VRLADAVDAPDATPDDVAALRTLFGEHQDIWRVFGDVGRQTERLMFEHARTHKSARLALENEAAALRRELGYDEAPALEQLLIQETVLAYLQLMFIRQKFDAVESVRAVASQAAPIGMVYEKRLTGAQRRFLRASQTLARVRRLKLPSLQVNVTASGGQQVNVLVPERERRKAGV
jgi:hypothetical protein